MLSDRVDGRDPLSLSPHIIVNTISATYAEVSIGSGRVSATSSPHI